MLKHDTTKHLLPPLDKRSAMGPLFIYWEEEEAIRRAGHAGRLTALQVNKNVFFPENITAHEMILFIENTFLLKVTWNNFSV